MTNIAVTVVSGTSSKDLSLAYDENETAAALVTAIEKGAGGADGSRVRVRRTGATVDPTAKLSTVDLLHGDVLELIGPDHAEQRPYLERLGDIGPRRVEIPVSGMRVGRMDVGNDLVLDDHTVSKAHASITCVDGRILLHDLGSTNGTTVNEIRVTGEMELAEGDIVEFGDHARFRVSGLSPDGSPTGSPAIGSHLTRSDGRLYVSRPWRQVRPRPEGNITVGPAPQAPRARRFPLPMIILPVVMGVVVVAVTGSVAFLAFGLLGPLMAGWNWYDDRRSGQKDHRAQVSKFDTDLQAARARALEVQREFAEWLTASTPTTEYAVEQVRSLSPQLWDRQPDHPDFLHIRIGTGNLAAADRVNVRDGGSDELRARALQLRDEFSIDRGVPISLDLQQEPVVTVVSRDPAEGRSLVRSMIVQLVARDSPNDVRVAAIGGNDWHWMAWLPHAERFGDGSPMIGHGADESARVVRAIETRIEAAATDQRSQHRATRLIIVAEAPMGIPAARINALLASAADADVTVIWISDASGPPPRSTVVVSVGTESSIQRGSGDAPVLIDQLEQADLGTATDVARRLAPLVDPGTGAETTVPDRVGLFDVLGHDCLDPEAIVRRWDREPDDHLYASVGIGKDGAVRLDLSNAGDGPNGLVAGTVGSGKSEFLQSLVLSLAADYGPEALNLLFVDFKGGLTFRDLVGLPHCVGMVRNLDGQLALRARRSLQAELRRRQRILHDHGAVNLTELRERAPDQMLPALVVIIDEYAELAQKLPEFLEGVVEIAQTGRALGIHLLLATQAPGQSVSRIIQNCVKYRISFRLKDSSESMEVLGRGRDASALPNHPGRGLLLDGDNRLHEFQAAWAGGRTDFDDTSQVSANTLYRPKAANSHHGNMPTDLERVVASICDAAAIARRPAPRRPWQEPLPATVTLDSLPPRNETGDDTRIPVGLVDLPDDQLQSRYDWTLSEAQNLLVLGDGRTGKTSTLRTIAASATACYDADQVELIGIDAAGGGLASIDVLPNVRTVIAATDTTRLRRIIASLKREERERQALVGRAGSLQAYRRSTGEQLPDIIVMIDGLVQLLSALEVIDNNTLSAAMQQLITDGAAMGIHFAMTTDQPQRVPMSIRNTARERLALRMSSRDSASAAEVQRDLSQLPDGRAISSLNNSAEVQIAIVAHGEVVDGPAQSQQLERLSSQLGERRAARRIPEPVEILLPDTLPPQNTPRGTVVLGVDDLFLEPVALDLVQNPTLVIAGPDLSGRTSTVEWIRDSLTRTIPELNSVYISGQGEDPMHTESWIHTFKRPYDAVDLLEALADTVVQHATLPEPVLLAIDDGDDLLENPIGASPEESAQHRRFSTALDSIVKGGRASGAIVVLAGRMNALIRASGWAQRLRQNQQALVLAPASLAGTVTDSTFNVAFPRRSEFRPSPGHGVLIRRGANTELIQVVHPQQG